MLVGEGSHPDKVKVYGPGVEKTGLKANEPTYFTVDCSEAGQGGLACGRGWRAFTKTLKSQLLIELVAKILIKYYISVEFG